MRSLIKACASHTYNICASLVSWLKGRQLAQLKVFCSCLNICESCQVPNFLLLAPITFAPLSFYMHVIHMDILRYDLRRVIYKLCDYKGI